MLCLPFFFFKRKTAYELRISDWSSDVCSSDLFEFRKRALHVGAAIGVHAIDHDEIYYVLSGTGIVHSDGEERPLKAGTAAWLYRGAKVGIRQTGGEPLVLIIAYPNQAAAR